MSATPPLQLVVGPSGHGVTSYAADVAAALRDIDPRTRILAAADLDSVRGQIASGTPVHLHVTDRLLGRSPEESAEALEHLALATRLTVTLHDLPQASDGTMRSRRVDAYGRMLAAVRGAAVNSRHEQALAAALPGSPRPHAIPLGTRRGHAPARPVGGGAADATHATRELAVLIAGFVYPGKGHAEAIRAAGAVAAGLRAEGRPLDRTVVRAIGGASAGHERDLRDLEELATSLGVSFEVTGHLDDAAFAARLTEPGIPLAAHQHVSASRSMLDWIEAGRRPLVADSTYSAETEALRPGTMRRFRPEELEASLRGAWDDPESTWLAPGALLAPTLVDVATAYASWWAAGSPAGAGGTDDGADAA